MVARTAADPEAITMQLRRRFVLESPRAGPNPLLCYVLCFSLLLHGMILALPVSSGNPTARNFKTMSIQARIRAPLMQTAADERSEMTRTERRSVTPSSIARGLAHTKTHRPAPQPPLKDHAPAPLESDAPPQPSFNIEDLREQARTLAREPSDQLVRGATANRHAPAKAVSDLADRPILAALSKRLGKTLVVISEQVLNDGSRFIRFSGNTCLRVPRHLSLGRESEITPTILVPTSCP